MGLRTARPIYAIPRYRIRILQNNDILRHWPLCRIGCLHPEPSISKQTFFRIWDVPTKWYHDVGSSSHRLVIYHRVVICFLFPLRCVLLGNVQTFQWYHMKVDNNNNENIIMIMIIKNMNIHYINDNNDDYMWLGGPTIIYYKDIYTYIYVNK